MLTKKFWLRLLNVDQGEWWVVKNLMILQFLQGAGIAFFFTASFASFLEKFPITELPFVMIGAAFLLWIFGWLYNKAEHALSFPKLVIGLTVLMAASFIIFRLFAYRSQEGIFLYLMLAWFHVLYLLNNLQFWGIATIIFDLRQSKRLFGLISSGDIPAKFVGYTLAYYVIGTVGKMNMLYMGAACLLGSIPFMLKIIRSGKLHIEHHDHHGGHHGGHHSLQEAVHHGTSKIMTLFRNFMSNSFISWIAFISMLAFIAILILDYGFYAEVQTVFEDDKNLGTFIAGFMAIMRISALFAKMIFTGRLTNSLGIRQTLLITPLTLIFLITVIFVTQFLTYNEKILFYEFGAAFIIIDVCRTVFNSPVLLTLMQPLPTHERLRAHNIVKGIMDPFAFLFTGLLLLLFSKIQGGASIVTLCYVALAICCLWIPGIVFVHRQYLKILVQTISSRYFSQEEFTLKDEAILQAIRKKIESGNDLEVISILKMLHTKKDPVAEDLVVQLLNHPSEQVQLETLRLISGKQTETIKGKLEELIAWTNNNDIRDEAIKAFSKTCALAGDVSDFLEHEDQGIRKATLSGMLENNEHYIRDLAQMQIESLIRSNNKLDKFFAAQILQEVKNDYNHPNLHLLITDPDVQVQAAGIKCIGKAATTLSLHALMEVLPHHSKAGLQALQDAGEKAVAVIGEGLASDRYQNWKDKFILVLGRIGGQHSQEELVRLLDGDPAELAPVIKALYRTKYVANEHTQRKMENLARLYLIYGVELLHMQRIMGEKEGYNILARSIEIEIQEIRDLLLSLFACMFDRVKMNQARKGLDSNINENIANAMELIELTVKKDFGRYFNHMFETTSIEHRCDTLRVLLKDVDFEKVEHIVAKVLTEKPIQFQNWTKACSLYITKKSLFRIEPGLIKKYSLSENRMVRETAEFAMANP
jgi:ATP:ADP antiporter, AAA family